MATLSRWAESRRSSLPWKVHAALQRVATPRRSIPGDANPSDDFGTLDDPADFGSDTLHEMDDLLDDDPGEFLSDGTAFDGDHDGEMGDTAGGSEVGGLPPNGVEGSRGTQGDEEQEEAVLSAARTPRELDEFYDHLLHVTPKDTRQTSLNSYVRESAGPSEHKTVAIGAVANLLALATAGRIHLAQAAPYGDVDITLLTDSAVEAE